MLLYITYQIKNHLYEIVIPFQLLGSNSGLGVGVSKPIVESKSGYIHEYYNKKKIGITHSQVVREILLIA